MHVLIVVSHPDQNSLSFALAKQFMDGVAKAGHTAEIADLHSEEFNPLWNMQDVAHNNGKAPVPEDVVREQARIERCDAVCMVFPLF